MVGKFYYSLFNQFLSLLLLFGSAAVLGRILDPSVFGIYALLMAVHAFLLPLIGFGLAPVYIKKKHINKEYENSLFTLYMFLFCIYVVIFMLISLFIKLPHLYIYTSIVLTGVFFLSLGQQKIAVLERQNNQKDIMKVNTIANILSVSIAILLAYTHYGIYALFAQFFFNALFRNMLLVKYTDVRYSFVSLKTLQKYKGDIVEAYHIFTSRVVNGLALSYDKFFLSYFFSMDIIGFYSKAFQLARFPDANISSALANPIFAYLAKKDSKEASHLYGVISHFIFFTAGNIALFFSMYGDWFMVFLLGDQWVEAGYYLQILSIWGVAKVFHGILNIIYTKEGKMDLFARYSLYILVCNGTTFIAVAYIFQNIYVVLYTFSFLNLLLWFFLFCWTLYKYSGKVVLFNGIKFLFLNVVGFVSILLYAKYTFFIESSFQFFMILPIFLVALFGSFLLIYIFKKQLLFDIRYLKETSK